MEGFVTESGIVVPGKPPSPTGHIPEAEGYERIALIGVEGREIEVSIMTESGEPIIHVASGTKLDGALGLTPDEMDALGDACHEAAQEGRRRRI